MCVTSTPLAQVNASIVCGVCVVVSERYSQTGDGGQVGMGDIPRCNVCFSGDDCSDVCIHSFLHSFSHSLNKVMREPPCSPRSVLA